MGLATRVIPSLLFRGDVLVKGKRFDSWRSVGHVLQAARVHAARGVDELIVLDIGATPEGRGPNLALVEKITDASFTPVTVGGGVRSVDDVRDLLRVGADKVAMGTTAIAAPMLLQECAMKFGSQAIAVSIDCRKSIPFTRCGADRVWSSPVHVALYLEKHGAGEILLTSIDREGTMNGYDLELIREVAAAVDIPVIAHGGCGTYQHMHDAIEAGASAVAAGAMFQFTDATPRGASAYLATKGVEVRL